MTISPRPYFRTREGDYGFTTRLNTQVAIRAFYFKSVEMQEIDRDFSQFLLETLKKKDYSSDRPVITFWDLPVELRIKLIRLIKDQCLTISLATTNDFSFKPSSILLYYNTFFVEDENFFSVIYGYEDKIPPIDFLNFPIGLSANNNQVSFIFLRDKNIHLSGEGYQSFDFYHALSAPLIDFNDDVINNIFYYGNTVGFIDQTPPENSYGLNNTKDPIFKDFGDPNKNFNNPNNSNDYDYGFGYKTPDNQELEEFEAVKYDFFNNPDFNPTGPSKGGLY